MKLKKKKKRKIAELFDFPFEILLARASLILHGRQFGTVFIVKLLFCSPLEESYVVWIYFFEIFIFSFDLTPYVLLDASA